MFEGSHGSSAMEWLGSALSPVSPERSDVPYGYGAGRPSHSSSCLSSALTAVGSLSTMASDEDLHIGLLEEGELSPSKSVFRDAIRWRGRRPSLRDESYSWHSFTVRVKLLLPLEEGKSFTEDVFSLSPTSESESMADIGPTMARCRSASASPSFERCKPAQDFGVDDKFRDDAKVIARDVARIYAGHEHVDQLRLEMAAVLRGYARRHPELGYTQGMCFLALVTCSKGKDLAEQLFEDYMTSLKLLWSPDFPLIQQGIPLLPGLLDKADMQLSYHLFHTLGLNLTAVLPTAWLSMFGKWLPFQQLLEIVPFLAASGLPGFLAATIVILTSFRSDLLDHQSVEDVLIFIAALRKSPAPANLMFLCRQILPGVREEVRNRFLAKNVRLNA